MKLYKEVNELDLAVLKEKLATSTSYPPHDINQIIILYKVFLHLKKKYPNELILPTEEVDLAWHTHILFTKKYHEDCKNIFGEYLHHTPAISEEEKERISSGIKRTYELVKKHFPELTE